MHDKIISIQSYRDFENVPRDIVEKLEQDILPLFVTTPTDVIKLSVIYIHPFRQSAEFLKRTIESTHLWCLDPKDYDLWAFGTNSKYDANDEYMQPLCSQAYVEKLLNTYFAHPVVRFFAEGEEV